jgi:hypothetical protein
MASSSSFGGATMLRLRQIIGRPRHSEAQNVQVADEGYTFSWTCSGGPCRFENAGTAHFGETERACRCEGCKKWKVVTGIFCLVEPLERRTQSHSCQVLRWQCPCCGNPGESLADRDQAEVVRTCGYCLCTVKMTS